MGCSFERQKKEISIVNAFKKKSQKDVNQIKYGLSKVVNLRIIFLKDCCETITLKCIQHTMKENLLLLKDL